MVNDLYLGSHTTVLDDAGRITVPRRFREIMERLDQITWFISPGLNGNLYLYPRDAWDRVVKQNEGAFETLDQSTHQFFSFGYGFTHETKVDRQGRMPVPPQLRELLGLEREVVLVGVQDRLEIWSKDARDAFCREMWPQYGKRATEMAASTRGGGNSQTAD